MDDYIKMVYDAISRGDFLQVAIGIAKLKELGGIEQSGELAIDFLREAVNHGSMELVNHLIDLEIVRVNPISDPIVPRAYD